MTQVIIGIDPHKGSHTALALDEREGKLGQLRVIAAPGQVQQLQRWAASWPERVWAIEGARGLGQLLAQQLIGAGERVVDVQPKLAARVRLLNTGKVNKNDPNDARSVAVAALRTHDAVEVIAENETSVLKLWSRRYQDLGSLRTQLVCRLHAVLCDLVPGGFARRISATQAIQILDSVTAQGAVAAAKLELARSSWLICNASTPSVCGETTPGQHGRSDNTTHRDPRRRPDHRRRGPRLRQRHPPLRQP